MSFRTRVVCSLELKPERELDRARPADLVQRTGQVVGGRAEVRVGEDLKYLPLNNLPPPVHVEQMALMGSSAGEPIPSDEHHQAIFNPNWSCRDDVAVVVINPAVVTGSPLAVYKLLFATSGEKFV
ncbi:MAG: hypothetical protein WCC92_08575 [Candidatus Korobacteraceae bacterium]